MLPEAEPAAIALVREAGGHYLDTRALPLEATHFHNVDHMNAEGARAYTEAIAQVLYTLPGLESYRPRRGQELDALRFVDHRDGVVSAYEPDVEYRSEPAPLPRAQRPLIAARKGMAYMETASFAFLSDASTIDLNPAARRCSPIRVLEDATPLRLGNVACEEVQEFKRGRYCHTPERIYLTASDDTWPTENGRAYELSLDPNRSCYGSQWLYPGDALRLRVPAEDLSAFTRPIRTLTVLAADRAPKGVQEPPATLVVRVRVNDRVRLEQQVSVAALAEGVPLVFDTPLGGQAADLVIEVENPSSRFVLLTSARLADR